MAQIPIMDFRGSKFVNEDGTLTEVSQSFFDLLTTILIKSIGQEGIVSPTQDSASIALIQDNQVSNVLTGNSSYTCQFGTLIYDSTNNKLIVALDDGFGIPVFKNVLTT